MKKLGVVLLVAMTAVAYGQEGLEQFYQNGNHYTKPEQVSAETKVEQCVEVKQQAPRPNLTGEKAEHESGYYSEDNCGNDPENCNCLNHEYEGYLSRYSIIDDEGEKCVPVNVYQRLQGERDWQNYNSNHPSYWCEGVPEETHRGNYQDEDSRHNGYKGEDYYKNPNPESGRSNPNCDDCLPYKDGPRG